MPRYRLRAQGTTVKRKPDDESVVRNAAEAKHNWELRNDRQIHL